MRQNYRGNKKRIEESKRKKQEKKRLKRMGKGEEIQGQPPVEGSVENPSSPETVA